VVATPVKPLSLEHVLDEPLAAAQLRLVVAQVQHERLMAASDIKDALEIGDHLAPLLSGPHPVAAQGVLVQIGPPGMPAPVPAPAPAPNLSAWQYVSAERDWVATVAPDFFSLETLSYGSWEQFRDRLGNLTAAVSEVLSPDLVQRVGLRYLNELRVAGVMTAVDWAGRISPSFLGPAQDHEVGPSVRSVQQAVEFQGPEHSRVTLRHGTVETLEGQPAYLLDHDCYSDRSRRFDASNLLAEYDGLHRLGLGVFQRAVTPEFYLQLKEGKVPA
jgi:uncharacterized protein (TIGR04255 family)